MEFLAIGVLLLLIAVLAYFSSRRRGSVGTSYDLGFAVLVAIGALAAPQFATVILLAMIYQQLVKNARTP